ncbi:hypothetical protein TREMEDRAFT_69802 [Tremella mesenterica DSM 1558]|nr:uncharacterized protein TREMEDRAFT_69802 [Tremella mesenterica DSM 1558]EIW67343.1 hypothetical protein TREMEDRAFT_69802 [Tremella mesenterica DSM 1558]
MTGIVFVLWHTWHYDRFKCLWYTRQNWFTVLMVHVLMTSLILFLVANSLQVHVSYKTYYVPVLGQVIEAPWQLWPEKYQHLWRQSLYVFTGGWILLQTVHLEEFLYWGYLIQSIRTPGGPKRTWLHSGWLKLFLGVVACSTALLYAALGIETTNLDMMRAYIFVVGGTMSCTMALASCYLCIIFPSFIRSVTRMGATYEVVERLSFFQETNSIRTVFRLIYSSCLTILSADALSKKQRINRSAVGTDILTILGYLGLFCATCISIIVLLPRNMAIESVPTQIPNLHPMIPYKRPLPSAASHKGFAELGDRLNIEPSGLAPVLEDDGEGYELSPATPHGRFRQEEAPFAGVADKSRKARMSEMPRLPSVLQKFKSPLEVTEHKRQGPPQVFVTTSHTVVRDS